MNENSKNEPPLYLQEVFAIKKIKNTIKREQNVALLYEFRAEKVIKRKGDKIYIKGYNTSFSSWINKKNIGHSMLVGQPSQKN